MSGFDTRILFPKTYLRAIDLDGKDVTVEIASVKNEPLPGDDDPHLVISFVGKKKTLGLNVTNRKCIEKMFGFLTKDWIHKSITFGVIKQPKAADGISIQIKGSPDITASSTVTVTKYLPTVKLVPTGTPNPPATVDHVTGEVGDDDIGFGDDAPYPSGNDTEAPSGASGAESDAGAADGTIPGRGAKSAQGELA